MQVAGAAAIAEAAGLAGSAAASSPSGGTAAKDCAAGTQPAEGTADPGAAAAGLARPSAFAAAAQQPEVAQQPGPAMAAADSGSCGEGMGALGSLFDDSGVQEEVQGVAADAAVLGDDWGVQDRTGAGTILSLP